MEDKGFSIKLVETCPAGFDVTLIVALAEGSLRNKEDIEKVHNHLPECDYCTAINKEVRAVDNEITKMAHLN